jgi:murein DD-endopeptidase MepM/ murein hydrolase activator NlpD
MWASVAGAWGANSAFIEARGRHVSERMLELASPRPGERLLELAWPAKGTITGPFGHDGARPHPGIDIGILRSLRVVAAAPGRVIATGEPKGFEGYGKLVEVRIDPDYVALYAHLAGWRVRVGEQVSAGQRLGTAGCTGWCTGTHLHFELRHLGLAVNPLRFRQKRDVRSSASFCFRSGGISSTAACLTNWRSSSSKR